MRISFLLVVSTLIANLGGQSPQNREEPGYRDPRLVEPGQIAPLLEGLGDHTHPVTTSSERAQLFFNQGLRLTYGFNHREAARAFREAARLDPDCGMCHWGLALVRGPNLNMPMDTEGAREAWQASRRALAVADRVSQQERDYIEALAVRYVEAPGEDRAQLDAAYSEAMARLAHLYPDDTDAATLYGAALMNQSPWDYWWADGTPHESTRVFLGTFERALQLDPRHPGALHYYIHAVEAQHPERGLAAAEMLDGLMPGAGHMVHMPSHIYMRLGRWEDAYRANIRAVAADEGYITQCRAQGLYPLAYYPHNIHFLWAATTAQGRSEEAIAAARKVAGRIPPDALKESPAFQTFKVVPYYALTRFGRWEEILAEPQPEENLLFVRAVWHYARGNAFRGLGRLDEATAELGRLQALVADERLGALIWLSPPADVLQLAALSLEGEIAAAAGKTDRAVALLDRAVRLQDAMAYNEPPDWHVPIRLSLGAVLLEGGRASEAEVVYWEQLKRTPAHGWTLFGLWQSLQAQQKPADLVRDRFEKAWAQADVTLQSSRF